MGWFIPFMIGGGVATIFGLGGDKEEQNYYGDVTKDEGGAVGKIVPYVALAAGGILIYKFIAGKN